jgi:hypothetical protein
VRAFFLAFAVLVAIPSLADAQGRIAYVSIQGGTYDAEALYGYTVLRSAGYAVDFFGISPTTGITADLSAYSQVWVIDFSANADDNALLLASYRRIADWFRSRVTESVVASTLAPPSVGYIRRRRS